ncbi:MAG TPA: hypothetical protein VIL73_09010 [Gaiellaceae bacterium]|jgi:hypothetical protein
MKFALPPVCAIALLLFVVTGCGGTKTVTKTVTVSDTAKSGAGSPRQVVEFGYVKSLKPKGSGYEMRFDPAWLLTGKTANQAALEDTGSSDVPNDSYVVNESTRAYTFLVPANAQVRVLTAGSNLNGTPITVAQLAQLAVGKNPLPKPLFEPISTGFWISIRNDTAESLDQQYHP